MLGCSKQNWPNLASPSTFTTSGLHCILHLPRSEPNFSQFRIQEAGIPIDMVGGVSIGAFMGALWCSERNVTTMTQKAREWSRKMTQWWRQIWDLTYPVTSMFSGHGFNQTIRETFGDIQIEDLWLPYFTITTDITSSQMRIHTHGT